MTEVVTANRVAEAKEEFDALVKSVEKTQETELQRLSDPKDRKEVIRKLEQLADMHIQLGKIYDELVQIIDPKPEVVFIPLTAGAISQTYLTFAPVQKAGLVEIGDSVTIHLPVEVELEGKTVTSVSTTVMKSKYLQCRGVIAKLFQAYDVCEGDVIAVTEISSHEFDLGVLCAEDFSDDCNTNPEDDDNDLCDD